MFFFSGHREGRHRWGSGKGGKAIDMIHCVNPPELKYILEIDHAHILCLRIQAEADSDERGAARAIELLSISVVEKNKGVHQICIDSVTYSPFSSAKSGPPL